MPDRRLASFALWSASTIFVSAFLLFQVQPVISRMILPWFGGSPAVWSTCMLFFQLLLLGGYAYAHYLTQWFQVRHQVLVHLTLLVLALCTLPITPDDSWRPADGSQPSLRILSVLLASVGLPYFLLSSTGPLVQAWFGQMEPGRTPYRLYALSNIGSLGALLSYPFLFEPRFTLLQQDHYWSFGFGLFALLNGVLAFFLWRQAPSLAAEATMPQIDMTNNPDDRPALLTKAAWLIYPALASVLLLAVTNHLSQDVAAVPFLWVLPLSLYLLTFILCFDSDRWYLRWLFAPAAMLLVGWLCVLETIYSLDNLCDKLHLGFEASQVIDGCMNKVIGVINSFTQPRGWPQLPDFEARHIDFQPLYLGLFFLSSLFVNCMLCHGELARLRPGKRWLTEYYLFISAGGALGGIFVALLCPRLFTWYAELPLANAAIFLLGGFVIVQLISQHLALHSSLRLAILTVGLSMAGATLGNSLTRFFPEGWLHWFVPLLGATTGAVIAVVIIYASQPKWQVFGSALAGLYTLAALFGLVLGSSMKTQSERVIAAERSFYGALQIKRNSSDEPAGLWLNHGRIQHGFQHEEPELRNQPTTYYAPDSGVGLAIRHHPRQENMRVGVVGLGTGSLAAYGKQGDYFCFYEIDQLVIRLSEKYFTFRSDTPAKNEVILGDARISMERQPSQEFDVLAIDAFSGDAIPVHLLTRECMDVYLKQLKPDGILAVHVSNRYLNLRPVVRGIARHAGWETVNISYSAPKPYDPSMPYCTASDWVLVTKNEEFLNDPVIIPHRPPLDPTDEKDNEVIEWTDQYSNLFQIFEG